MVFVMITRRAINRAKARAYKYDFHNQTRMDQTADQKVDGEESGSSSRTYKILTTAEVEVTTHTALPITGHTVRAGEAKQRIRSNLGRNKRIFVAAENVDDGKVLYLFLTPRYDSIVNTFTEGELVDLSGVRPDASKAANGGLAVMSSSNTIVRKCERAPIDGTDACTAAVYSFEPIGSSRLKNETYEMTLASPQRMKHDDFAFEDTMNRLSENENFMQTE